MPAKKKIKETDAIFEQLKEENDRADADDTVLRLSLDAKATVKIGLFCRGGRSWVEVKALDHDFAADATLTPFGILLPRFGDLSLYFAQSALTSDFIADTLEMWWEGDLVSRNCVSRSSTSVFASSSSPYSHSV